jgi:hypothetical protein
MAKDTPVDDGRIDKLEQGFKFAGTTRQHGRAQRHVDRAAGVDRMAEMHKIPGKRPRIRRKRRPGEFEKRQKPLPPVPEQ